jgi:hypothetical protein
MQPNHAAALGVGAAALQVFDLSDGRRLFGYRLEVPRKATHETIKAMSIYRMANRSPRSDVHHVVDHALGPYGRQQQGTLRPNEEDWTVRRIARPADFLFPATKRWIAALPRELQPNATADAFPRILNAIAGLWSVPKELMSYFTELLVDKRGRRLGFPVRVLGELHALRAYYAMLHS